MVEKSPSGLLPLIWHSISATLFYLYLFFYYFFQPKYSLPVSHSVPTPFQKFLLLSSSSSRPLYILPQKQRIFSPSIYISIYYWGSTALASFSSMVDFWGVNLLFSLHVFCLFSSLFLFLFGPFLCYCSIIFKVKYWLFFIFLACCFSFQRFFLWVCVFVLLCMDFILVMMNWYLVTSFYWFVKICWRNVGFWCSMISSCVLYRQTEEVLGSVILLLHCCTASNGLMLPLLSWRIYKYMLFLFGSNREIFWWVVPCFLKWLLQIIYLILVLLLIWIL